MILPDAYTRLVTGRVIEAIEQGALRATKFLTPKRVIRATRRTYRRARAKVRKDANIEIVLTIGQPNYRERAFIKAAVAAGEPFPVSKIQVKQPK